MAFSASLDIVLANPLYKIRRVRDDEILHHSIFASFEMTAMSKVSGQMLRPKARAHIFCSSLQIGPCYCVFSKEV